MKYKCATCNGEYIDTSIDSVPYYHACAPILESKDKYIDRTDKRDENAGKKLEGKGRVKI